MTSKHKRLIGKVGIFAMGSLYIILVLLGVGLGMSLLSAWLLTTIIVIPPHIVFVMLADSGVPHGA